MIFNTTVNATVNCDTPIYIVYIVNDLVHPYVALYCIAVELKLKSKDATFYPELYSMHINLALHFKRSLR